MTRSKQKLIEFVLLFVSANILLLSKFSYSCAASPSLVINEVYYDAADNRGGDAKGEWFELYNSSNSSIDPQNWVISDNNSDRILSTRPLLISPSTFVLVVRDKSILPLWDIDIDSLPSNLQVIELAPWFSGGLSNSGDRLVLKNSSGDLLDSISWGSDKTIFDLPLVAESHSYDRTILGTDTDTVYDFMSRNLPSPGREYIKPIYSGNVVISEILPQPGNGYENEFIEIYNNSSTPIDLSGWQIDDSSGGSSPFNIQSTIINPYEYLVFYSKDTKIALNDSGDNARLLDPNGEVRSEVNYSKAEKGLSYSLVMNAWYWNTALTPTQPNMLVYRTVLASNQNNKELSTVESARALPDGEKVSVNGTVTAAPGVLSSQYFYLQDETGGIQGYSYDKNFPVLKSGDEVAISGELAGAAADRRIKITAIKLAGQGNLPEAKEVKIGQILEALEGQYVRTRGVVRSTSGNSFVLEDSGLIEVLIRATTQIKKPAMRKGNFVEVTGIVSEYNGKYRILPFRQEDVKITKSSGRDILPETGANEWVSLFLSLALSILWNLSQKVIQKLKNLLKV